MSAKTRAVELLDALKAAIDSIPPGFVAGTRHGPLAKYLTPEMSNDDPSVEIFPHDPENGAYYSFSTEWERVFQAKSASEPLEAKFPLVCRGKHGLILAYAWASHYVNLQSVKDAEIEMMVPRLEALLVLIPAALKAHKPKAKKSVDSSDDDDESPTTVLPKAKAAVKPSAGKGKAKKIAVSKEKASAKKTKTGSAANDADPISLVSDDDAEQQKTSPKKRKNPAPDGSESESESAPKPKKSKPSAAPADESDSSDDASVKRGAKLRWALSQFRTPKASTSKNGDLTWTFKCRYCAIFRTSPRSAGIAKFEDETQKIKLPSNFTGHADSCNSRPSAQSWANFQEAEARARKGLPPLLDAAVPASVEAQRGMMQAFIQQGIDHPAKKVTQRSYRKYLLQAIVRDDLAFRVTENEGMLDLLTHILPPKLRARVSHQTVARDLKVLHQALDKKLENMIKASLLNNKSKISIATDLGTTKNMVHAFCGVTVTFIDDDWVLQEHVLDLIPLHGDHSGEAVAKLVFTSLHSRKMDDRLLACGADNASSNGTMSRALVRFCIRKNPDVGTARNMQIGCGGHVTNLVAQNITATLSLAPPLAKKDLYEETRKYPLVYDPAEDPVVIAEMEEMENDRKKGELEKDIHDPDPSGSDLSASENEEEDLWVDEAGELYGESGSEGEMEVEAEEVVPAVEKSGKAARKGKKGKKAKKPKPKKVWTPVDKIHASVVHILRSEIRRKKARILIYKLADQEFQHLVFMRSMVIRWNTMYAEMRRARSLSAPLDAFVADMARGLSGKAKAAALARKKKWEMHSSDWEFIDKLMSALEVLQDVTLEFSKKGVPTICKVLPLYKLMETKLAQLADEYEYDDFNIARALRAGSEKAKQYVGKALISDYPLLGAVLHPAIRLAFFETSDWDPEVPKRAYSLLTTLVRKYSDSPTTTSASCAKPTKGIFAMAIKGHAETQKKTSFAGKDEVDMYLSGISPVEDGFEDPLGWWKQNHGTLPSIARVARDILAIPGVSIAVERLFSSMKHTLTDDRTSMTPENSSMCIVTKERLKSGLCEGLDWTQLLNVNEYS
ncbi:Reverse transcriptase-RNase H-integrase [Mycena sanguinolenta]|uniref:Reverse transcriptase-RNase H-integrase n=1 Tax=Mycena sanguinolenta TaxID=230812 RepID=A0A8H6ZKE9_9AGAR|nr:Reverse transcriptase-RNase H-integrase [Mycena sanguinolenta]